MMLETKSGQAVVGKSQRIAQGHTHRVGKLQGCGPGASFASVDGDKIRVDFGFDHRLTDRHELASVTDTQLKSHWFPLGEITQALDKLEQADGRGKFAMIRRRIDLL